jgi:imidazole glycerol-phosphate synthase subunit HisH
LRVALKKIGILDYGVGNIASLKGALEKLGFHVTVGRTELSLSSVETIFLPGVGCFSYAMENLRHLKMDKFLKNRFDAQDMKVIGICLGMQILFEHSEEGNSDGLGLMQGRVKRFSEKECHVGWNIAAPIQGTVIQGNSGFYFNHSYYVDCAANLTLATSHYQCDFPVVVNKNRFYGVQFHPEKSQNMGVQIINTLVGAE